ncbi:hypothetical protein V6N13_091505 [Hibiscus sabdariffa]
MAHSIDKPPFFNGEHCACWKNRMMLFIKAKDFNLWDRVEDGPFVPTRSESEWDANDRKKMKLNCKALHILFCTNDVNETKIDLLNLEYENFKMHPNEDIKSMFKLFSIIVNQLKGFGEEISEEKFVRKLIYSLPELWDNKKTTIIEASNLKKLKIDELIRSLITHELMPISLKRENEKIIKEQGIDVNFVAPKSSKKHQEYSSEEDSEEDDEINYLVKNFTRFMKYEKEKSRHETKKKMKEPPKSSKFQ